MTKVDKLELYHEIDEAISEQVRNYYTCTTIGLHKTHAMWYLYNEDAVQTAKIERIKYLTKNPPWWYNHEHYFANDKKWSEFVNKYYFKYYRKSKSKSKYFRKSNVQKRVNYIFERSRF